MRGAVRRLMTQDKWIISFVGAHAAIGMLSTFWIRRFGRAPFPNDVVSWEMVRAMRVFVSQGMLVGLAILLGIWAALGTSHWMARTAGFVVGVGCSGLLSCMSTSRYSFTECSAEVGSAVCVAVALWMVRRAGIGVRRLTASESKSGGMQLSIRQLMILTIIVGCVVASPRWFPRMPLLFAGFLGLVLPWSILGTKNPLPSFVAVCIAVVAWAVTTYGGSGVFEHPVRFTMLVTRTIATALLVASSLTFVRLRGFRLTNYWLSSACQSPMDPARAIR